MEEHDWPDFYPDHLKLISWCIDGKAAGPYSYWTKDLDPFYDESPLYVKSIMTDIFTDNKVSIDFCKNYIDWILKRFTFYMGYNDNEFKYSLKKDKKTKQPIFNAADYYKMADKEFGFDKKAAAELLKYVISETLKFYNQYAPDEIDLKYAKYSKKLKFDENGYTVGFSEREEAMLNDIIKGLEDDKSK